MENQKGRMKEKLPVSLDALNELLTERQRYEEWLAALESRRGDTQPAVYQRVQADYSSRLREVSEKLVDRAGELRTTIESLSARLQEVSGEESAQLELRQESELRAAVGEFSPEQWEKLKQDSEKELARIAKDRESVETQLSELNRIVALSTKPREADSKQGAANAASAQPSTPQQSQPVQSHSAQSQHAGSSQTGTPRSGPTQTDLPLTPPPPQGPVAQPTPQDFNGQQKATPAPPKKQAVPAAAAAKSSQGAAASQKRPGGLPDLRTEQQKTLKCPECGAANYPTEWYCERCGGELATL